VRDNYTSATKLPLEAGSRGFQSELSPVGVGDNSVLSRCSIENKIFEPCGKVVHLFTIGLRIVFILWFPLKLFYVRRCVIVYVKPMSDNPH